MPVEYKECARCKKPYVAVKNYKSCLLCWKRERGYELTKADEAFEDLQNATAEILTRMRKLEKKLTEVKPQIEQAAVLLQDFKKKLEEVDELTKRVEKADALAKKLKKDLLAKEQEKQKVKVVKEAIPQELLVDMIRLCHPDSHVHSAKLQAKGTEIVKWLYEQRR